METHHKITSTPNHNGFEFDYSHNVIFFGGKVIRLSPHESDILRVLLNNRARPTPIGVLIQRVYGVNEPDSAAVSIRVAIHSLRKKKILETGMSIQVEPRVG
jgi:DNA-binding response OmpR family regulator